MLAIAIPSRVGGKKTYWCPSRNAMGNVPHLPSYNWLQKGSKMRSTQESDGTRDFGGFGFQG